MHPHLVDNKKLIDAVTHLYKYRIAISILKADKPEFQWDMISIVNWTVTYTQPDIMVVDE